MYILNINQYRNKGSIKKPLYFLRTKIISGEKTKTKTTKQRLLEHRRQQMASMNFGELQRNQCFKEKNNRVKQRLGEPSTQIDGKG